MKRILCLTLVIVSFALCYQNVEAKDKVFRFGVKGSLNYTSFKDLNFDNFPSFKESVKGYTGFNAGLLFKVKLPLGFAIQPAVLYSQSGSSMEMELDYSSSTYNPIDISDFKTTLKRSTIEIPIDVQWGVKLGPVRPYVMVSPYVGFALKNKLQIGNTETTLDDYLSKLDYGIGLGAGIELWMIQISFKYKWALGNVFDLKDGDIPGVQDLFDKTKLQGFEVGLAILF